MTLEEQIIEILAKKKTRSLIQVVAELNRSNGNAYRIREIEEVLRRMPNVFQNDHRKYGLRNRGAFQDPIEPMAV